MIELNWGLRRAYRRAVDRLKVFKRYGITSPIVVLSMPKTGSTSVSRTIKGLSLDVPVHHVHALNDFDRLAEQAGKWGDARTFRQAIEDGRALREAIECWRGGPWNLISLVREPVGRAVSWSFHHAIPGRFPDLSERMRSGELDVPQIRELLVGRFLGDWSGWFDRQVRDPFGIDVYAAPFPKEAGYAIYEGRRARLLLLRLESLEARAAEAFRRFLNIPDFQPIRTNTAEEKHYKDLYRRFRREAALPEGCLDRMYGSRMARHFYTDEELRRFKRQWLGDGAMTA